MARRASRNLRLVAMTAAAAAATAAAALSGGPASAAPSAGASRASAVTAGDVQDAHHGPKVVGGYRHLVVIYQENHSFDNLYGSWGRVGRQRVDGLADAPLAQTTQLAQDGLPYGCLLQKDVNLASPPLPSACSDVAHGIGASRFANSPFRIDDYIPADATTCPAPGTQPANGVPAGTGSEGGCTRDMVHRFYQEAFQIHGGKQDRYVQGSDAAGLVMGTYDTKQLPIYRYLHSKGAPNYVVADRFFQAAFGGSYLNHQYLVAARTPIDTSAAPGGVNAALHSVLDANGYPSRTAPLYVPTRTDVRDFPITQACGPAALPGYACGDYAVNTLQPANGPKAAGRVLPPVDSDLYPTIGDRLSDAGVSWNWYAGGWKEAEAGTPGPLFQFHHQPLTYFSHFAPGTPGRTHLRDETEFTDAAEAGTLPTVSFVKPYGTDNEHPGYTNEHDGSDHLVNLIKSVAEGPQGKDTLIVVTYDEFGGQWDHVSPPGAGSPTPGAYDLFGPGTRIPALVLSAGMSRSGVDHTSYDTTSILATIERGLGLEALDTRDAAVNDLGAAVRLGGGRGRG